MIPSQNIAALPWMRYRDLSLRQRAGNRSLAVHHSFKKRYIPKYLYKINHVLVSPETLVKPRFFDWQMYKYFRASTCSNPKYL